MVMLTVMLLAGIVGLLIGLAFFALFMLELWLRR